MDSLANAVLDRLRATVADYRALTVDIGPEGLNWTPGQETNSIAVLIAHSARATVFWLEAAVDPQVDRDAFVRENAETFSSGADGLALRQTLDRLDADGARLLAKVDPGEYDTIRSWPSRPAPVSVAWCLVHAVDHMREHLGAAMLTRQLWFFQGGS